MKVARGRYAPSPTGSLHLGNARTALVAYLQARCADASFVMRVEDLDRARSKNEMVAVNLNELRWLGLDWDEGPDVGGIYAPYIQSERFDLYDKALSDLKEKGRIYECYLSRKDLREISSAPHGQMPRYGKAERSLNEKLKAKKMSEGKLPALRFRVDEDSVLFHDEFLGRQSVTVGDFVVKRADNEWAYQLAVVTDDSAMKIEEVVRGSDLLESTAAQLLLYKALEENPPKFLHVPLLFDSTGERMAKRRGSLTLTELMKTSSPERVLGLLAYSLGLCDNPVTMSMRDILRAYTLEKLPKKPFTLTEELVQWLIT